MKMEAHTRRKHRKNRRKRMLSGLLSKEDAGRLEIPNNFYKEIIEIWTELSYQNLTHANVFPT